MNTSPSPLPSSPLAALSAKNLWTLFTRTGAEARRSTQRFLAMLPEIERRRLHRKKRFTSLVECAQRIGGVSRRVVEEMLRLHRRLEGLPEVWALIESGEVGWSKVSRVPEGLLRAAPQAWVRNLRELGKRELEELLRAERERSEGKRVVTGVARSEVSHGTPRVHELGPVGQPALEPPPPRTSEATRAGGALVEVTPGRNSVGDLGEDPEALSDQWLAPGFGTQPRRTVRIELRLDEAEHARLLQVQRDHHQRTGEAVSLAELVHQLLEAAWLEEDPQRGQELGAEERRRLEAEAVASAEASQGAEPPPRVERWVKIRAGGVCERAGCTRPGEHLHHLRGRDVAVPHHPENLGWICGTCHSLKHLGRIENPTDPPGQWRVRSAGQAPELAKEDQAYRRQRRAAVGGPGSRDPERGAGSG